MVVSIPFCAALDGEVRPKSSLAFSSAMLSWSSLTISCHHFAANNRAFRLKLSFASNWASLSSSSLTTALRPFATSRNDDVRRPLSLVPGLAVLLNNRLTTASCMLPRTHNNIV